MFGRWLIIVGSILHIGAYFVAAPKHVVDPSWPDHARFHILQAIFWITGLDITAAVIGFYLLPSTKTWIKLLLSFIFVTAHLSYFISMFLIPAGRPPEFSAHLILGSFSSVYLAGLVMIVRGRVPSEQHR